MSDKASPTFYLIHGDDDLALDQVLDKLRSGMGDNGDLNTSEFEGDETSVAEVIGAVRSMPFLADKRLVIVKNLVSHITRQGAGNVGKQEVERLLDELPNLPPHARLVMVERKDLSEKNRVWKNVTSLGNGYCKAFRVPKDTTQWIRKRAKDEYEIDIEAPAAVALASVTGNDLRRADNELHKLVCYVDDAGVITESDVQQLTPYVPEANVFAVVDALATGDGNTALSLMHRALDENPRDPGFGLFALIVRQFRLLILTREHLSNGGSSGGASIAKAIGIRSSWQADKLAKQSRAFTVEQLERIYRRLQQYDQDMKTGLIEPRLALDLLVASLAQKA